MLRRAEALLNPTARPPEAPPTDGLSPFYWHYLGQQRWLLGALFLFGGMIAVLDVTIPAFIGRVVGLVSTHNAATFLRDTWPQFAVMVVVLALLRPLALLCQVVTIEPDREPRPVKHDPLAEPLARGAAKLDVLPERLRRPH